MDIEDAEDIGISVGAGILASYLTVKLMEATYRPKKKLLLLLSPRYQTDEIKSAINTYREAIYTEGWSLIVHDLITDESSSWERVRSIIDNEYKKETHLANLLIGDDIDYALSRIAINIWGTDECYPTLAPYASIPSEYTPTDCGLKMTSKHGDYLVRIPTSVLIPCICESIDTRRKRVYNTLLKFANRNFNYSNKAIAIISPGYSTLEDICDVKKYASRLGNLAVISGRYPTKEELDRLKTQKHKFVYLQAHASTGGLSFLYNVYGVSDFWKTITPFEILYGCEVSGWAPGRGCTYLPPSTYAHYLASAILINPDLRLACLGIGSKSWAFCPRICCTKRRPPQCPPNCRLLPHGKNCIIDNESPCVYDQDILSILPNMANGKSFAEAIVSKRLFDIIMIHGDPTFRYPD